MDPSELELDNNNANGEDNDDLLIQMCSLKNPDYFRRIMKPKSISDIHNGKILQGSGKTELDYENVLSDLKSIHSKIYDLEATNNNKDDSEIVRLDNVKKSPPVKETPKVSTEKDVPKVVTVIPDEAGPSVIRITLDTPPKQNGPSKSPKFFKSKMTRKRISATSVVNHSIDLSRTRAAKSRAIEIISLNADENSPNEDTSKDAYDEFFDNVPELEEIETGICPMCNLPFPMARLEIHAQYCGGN